MKKYLIIFNPFAGKGRALKHKEQIINFFLENNLPYLIKQTHKQKDAFHIARKYCQTDYDHYVICGGDGTINEVVNGLLPDHNKTLIFIPLGTVNIFAKENNIPKKISSALKLIFYGSIKNITAGSCGNKDFLLMQSVGIDSYVVKNVTPKLKKRFGLLAYIIVFMKSIFTYDYPQIIVENENSSTFLGTYVLVSKCKYYGGFLKITPDAHLDNNFLTVCILTKKGIIPLLKILFLSSIGLNHLNKDCIFFKTKHVKIYGEKLHSQIDGELGPTLPLHIYIKSKNVKFIVNETQSEK